MIQPDSLQDLYVEVGDRVTYCLMDNKEQKHSVQIVDSESNAKMGLINEETPLAHALIGLSPGEIGTIEVSGQPPRQICVLKILRQGELTLDN
ncbi:MAG: GreA/GreB family elongation factor [Thauera sp.]|nr:GreA/GreB family elongation factor [Thauera sp.]